MNTVIFVAITAWIIHERKASLEKSTRLHRPEDFTEITEQVLDPDDWSGWKLHFNLIPTEVNLSKPEGF